MNYLTYKNFRQKYGNARGICNVDKGEFIIEVPYHSSTRVKTHEVGHAKYNHQQEWVDSDIYYDKIFEHEVEAELFSYHVMGKPLTMYILSAALLNLTQQMHDTHYANWLFNKSIQALEKNYIKLNCIDKSILWNTIVGWLRKQNKEYKK